MRYSDANFSDDRLLLDHRRFTGMSAPVVRLPLRLLRQAVALVTEEYGSGYIDSRAYHLLHLLGAVLLGRLKVFCVLDEGSLAGIIAIRQTPYLPGTAELGMQIVRKDMRRQGIGSALVEFAVREALQTGASGCFGHCVTSHPYSQAELERCGLAPCGLLFSRYDERQLYPDKVDAGRHTLAVLACMGRNMPPRRLYPPSSLACAAAQYYPDADLQPDETDRTFPAFDTWLWVKDDLEHRSCELFIITPGNDFAKCLPQILQRKPHEENWVFDVYLNLLHPTCSHAYRILLQYGFFFAGFHPHCEGAEYLLLHAEKMQIPFDAFCTTQRVGMLVEAIRPYYAARRQEGFQKLWKKKGTE